MTGLWIERRELHPDALRLEDLARDRAPAGHDVTCRPCAAAPGDWSDAERLWDRFLSAGTRAPAFRLVRDGSTLSRSRSTRQASVGSQRIDDLVEPNHVLEHYAAGATVVLQALQFSDPVFAKMSTNLALALDQPVQVNAYLSPPAARGLDIHFDYHDVFVVQLAGRKRWRVWDPLPRTLRPVKRGLATSQPSLSELGATLLDRVVEPGDCIVVPRGFPHEAETVDEDSVHLTIGVMTITWNRLLRDRIDDVASGSALADAVDASDVDGRDAALAALTDALDPIDVRRAIASDVWRRQPQTRLRPRAAPHIEPDDIVTFTPGPLLWIDDRADPTRRKHSLELGDRRLRFPPDCNSFVAAVLRARAPFRAAELEGDIDDASRRVLIQRLAVEGIVTRA